MDPAVLVLFMIIGAGVSSVIAAQKHRSIGGWLVFGAFFPLIAIVAVACLPAKSTEAAA